MAAENNFEGNIQPPQQEHNTAREKRHPVRRAIDAARGLMRPSRTKHESTQDKPEMIPPPLSEAAQQETQIREQLRAAHSLNEAQTPLAEPIVLTPRLEQVFGRNRIEQTNKNAASSEDVLGIVKAFESAVEARRQRYLNLEKRDIAPEEPFSSLRDGISRNDYDNYVRRRFFPYENPKAYEEAPLDEKGRPYLASFENIMLEKDDQGHITAREHFYIDRDYKAYVARTIIDPSNQEVTEKIPASYVDAARAMDAVHNRTVGVNNISEEPPLPDTPQNRLERLASEDLIKQYKNTLSEVPAFVSAVVEQYSNTPLSEITDALKGKALNEFWAGSGKGVEFLLNDRLVQVAYFRDIDEHHSDTIPDSPGGYETLSVTLHPADNARIMQYISLSTDPRRSGVSSIGSISYVEMKPQGKTYIANSSSSVEGSKEKTMRGAEKVINILAGREKPESLYGLDINGVATAEERTFYLISDNPPTLRFPDHVRSDAKVHEQQRELDLSSLIEPTEKKMDKTLDQPYDPSLREDPKE